MAQRVAPFLRLSTSPGSSTSARIPPLSAFKLCRRVSDLWCGVQRSYILSGKLTDAELTQINGYVINPVESREASLDTFETLKTEYDIPTEVEVLKGFRAMNYEDISEFIRETGLAMDEDDLRYCQKYFASEKRDPTITEIKMIDTYWSDHCRHTTFNTIIDSVRFEDVTLQNAWNRYLDTRNELGRTKPICLMDIGTLAAKQLKAQGKLSKLDESDEINACTVKIDVETENGTEKWLLLFKKRNSQSPDGNRTLRRGGDLHRWSHTRPAFRSQLRSMPQCVYRARLTPLKPISETLKGKLPQKKLVSTAAAGYSSYGNQIGLTTGIVDEIYHPGYAAKHMEVGAVIGAAPEENVRREEPSRAISSFFSVEEQDAMAAAELQAPPRCTTFSSLGNCGAEVQKGNAPEERKLQRLFRNPEATRLIKRCNDFGAGGVSVAIGELAEGLKINLNAIPKKYEGLDGTELAISESQERMAVVVDKHYVNRFMELAASENLEATVVAEVYEFPRLIMNWNGKAIVNVTRRFLDSNGAEKHIDISPSVPQNYIKEHPTDFMSGMINLISDLNVCSKRGAF